MICSDEEIELDSENKREKTATAKQTKKKKKNIGISIHIINPKMSAIKSIVRDFRGKACVVNAMQCNAMRYTS